MTKDPVVPWSLDEFLERIARISVQAAGEKEQGLAELFLLDTNNTMTLAGLSVGGGEEVAWAARSLIFLLEPMHAVLGIEGWTPRRDLPETDPDVRRAIMGETAISGMPRHKRGEVLILYGESASGSKDYQMWDLKSSGPPDYKRTGIERLEHPKDAGNVKMTSRFEPLFIVDNALRQIDEADPNDADYRLLQEAGRYLSPKRRRTLVRNVVQQLLVKGSGMTTRQWEEWTKMAHRESIHKIVTEGGPAAE